MSSILSEDDPLGIGSLFCETNLAKSANKATVRPFSSSVSNIPAPPSIDDIITGSQMTSEIDHGISASQLMANSRFKAPKGILKRKHDHKDDTSLPHSQSSSFLSSFDDDLLNLEFPQMSQDVLKSSTGNQSSGGVGINESSQRSLLQNVDGNDVIPSSQPPRSSGKKFIPSFTSNKAKKLPVQTPSASSNHDSRPPLQLLRTPAMSHGNVPYYQQMLADTPNTLDIPGAITPGGSVYGNQKLRSIDEIPEPYRGIFPFPYFNIVQSKVLDDVLYSDRPIVVCAPTGAGKTVAFELAIVRLLIAMGQAASNSKIVYMAPIKVLCSQRCQDWKEKFEPLGLKCQELTGDTDIDDYFLLQTVNIVCTTPEKWDSMTRKWRDNKSLVQLVRLFLIDEVHSLNDESRGATVEAVISRMKTVQAAVERESDKLNDDTNTTNSTLRFMAVSATIPNIEDVAEWLGSERNPAIHHKMDDSHRPVKLRKVVLGFPCSENRSEFRFDLSLNYKLSGVIQTYSDQKPTLVFCATRKGVQQAASILVKEARFILNAQHRQRLQKCANMLRESKLRDLIIHGVGFHHAGLDLQDRKAIEEIFTKGDLPVLMATSTLAMGVNLPAHLVIVKSTMHYMGSMYTDYSETQILQMIGRAGRPQFDTSATAVIMTKNSTKRKYEMLLGGQENIESSLHNHLIEHLNAEVVLHTINDISVAIEWLKSTFLFVRIKKNSAHYGIPVGLSDEELEKKLQDMCIKDLNLLAQYKLVHMDGETMDLKPTETGRLMARYCIAFDTMQRFSKITGTETMEELIFMLAECKEFADIQLRVTERRSLNMLNKDKNRATIRYPMTGKIKTTSMKVNCLIQATLGCLPVQDFALSQDGVKIFRVGQRTTRCLMEFLQQRADFKAFLNATIISKCFHARLWENSKFVTRQIDKIGPTLATALVNAGIVSFQRVEDTNPRELELIVNRHPPFGNQIQDAVIHLPKYDVSIEQVNKYNPSTAEIIVTVSIMNQEILNEKQTAKSNHACTLIIGDTDNQIVTKQRIMDGYVLKTGPWTRKIEVKRAARGEELSVNLISQDYVGLDVQSTYTPFYSGPKHLRATPMGGPPMAAPTSGYNQQNTSQSGNKIRKHLTFQSAVDVNRSPDETSEYFSGRKPCSHRCTNKDTCAHECCKFGVPIKPVSLSKATNKTKKLLQPVGISETAKNSKLDGYITQLHAKTHAMPSTPALKRLKPNHKEDEAINLQKFAYTPRGSVQSNMRPISASHTSPPKTPATPSGRGWEHLDLYHQQRYQQFQETEDYEADASITMPHGGQELEHGFEDQEGIIEEFDNALPSFDVDWDGIIHGGNNNGVQNNKQKEHSMYNQTPSTTQSHSGYTSSSASRHQGRVFAWKSPVRTNTSKITPRSAPHLADGVNRLDSQRSNTRAQHSYSNFTSAKHLLQDRSMTSNQIPMLRMGTHQCPPSQKIQQEIPHLMFQQQMIVQQDNSKSCPRSQGTTQLQPRQSEASDVQQWSASTPRQSPEILSVNSSPMSLDAAITPVIVLSDGEGSVHSVGLSGVSSPDEMMMKCVEAEEAKYSQEQLSPVMPSSRCHPTVDANPTSEPFAPVKNSMKRPQASKSFFSSATHSATETDNVLETFDSIFQGIF